jgi:hypothetical protein
MIQHETIESIREAHAGHFINGASIGGNRSAEWSYSERYGADDQYGGRAVGTSATSLRNVHVHRHRAAGLRSRAQVLKLLSFLCDRWINSYFLFFSLPDCEAVRQRRV